MFGEGFKRKLTVMVTLVGLLGIYLALDSRLVKGEDAYAQLGRGFEDINEAYNLLYTEYFKELEPEALSKSAIEGMLNDLDPYTSFYDRRALEQLQIETRGNFGGLGITISKRGDEKGPPVVMSVIEGTPADTARLLVGDRIIAIEGDSTYAKTLREVVDVLRGEPGAGVNITVDRPGRAMPFKQPIIRARIDIPSVAMPGEVDPEIGYISMSDLNSGRFTERTSSELEEIIRSLLDKRVKGIVLDLRGNPGGLLNAAVDVVDKFLEPGLVVVSTKGRRPEQSRSHKTREMAVAVEVPLVVLVNGRSASASEIVAGAIQDWDRGLVLGTQTFGKGSVQTVRQLGRGDKALKLTTAAYYTPSGRSIHSTSQRMFRGGPLEFTVADSIRISAYELLGILGQADRREHAVTELKERFGIDDNQAEEVLDMRLETLLGLSVRESGADPKIDPEEIFKTRRRGRTVYGGGGIKPDVEVEQERRPRLVIALDRGWQLFDFTVQYAANRTFPVRYENYRLPDTIVDEFWAYMADSTHARGFDYKTATEIQLQAFEQTLKEKGILTEADKMALKQLAGIAERERKADYESVAAIIRNEIERILARRVWGTQAEILASLKSDRQFQEAVRILKDRPFYDQKLALGNR